jgi:aspartyl-tRNA synthetase
MKKPCLDLVQINRIHVFSGTIAKGGMVQGINIKGQMDAYSRNNIKKLEKFVADYGAKGLAWFKIKEDGVNSPIQKFLSEEEG